MSVSSYFEHSALGSPHAVFPLGGIGSGCIGIGADGRLQDWEIFNRPAKGTVQGFSHFAIRAERNGDVLDTRILNGPFGGNRSGTMNGQPFNTFGFGPRREYMTGFPHFRRSLLLGPFPVANLVFDDPRFPGEVRMRALSPFVPLDARVSSLPVAQFEVTIVNSGPEDIDYTVFGCIAFAMDSVTVTADRTRGLTLAGRSGAGATDTAYAELALATDHSDCSFQRHLFRGAWFDTMEVYWADISRGGRLSDRFYGDAAGSPSAPEHGVMALHASVPAGRSRTVRLAIAWYVPNVTKTWVSRLRPTKENQAIKPVWRNYYATEWGGVGDVLAETFSDWDGLVDRTVTFRDSLTESTLPLPVLDAVSANLSILRSPTCLRLEDGSLYGWEGCHPASGCCEGTCTHVWNYQQVVPFLFPDLERSMRENDFFENQNPATGAMAFRMLLPKGLGTGSERPCADGQFGGVMKTYRDWKISGDTDWLRGIWPNVTASIEYAWHPDNYDRWDPERAGVLTGRQHHTLDMELFGPNGWLNGFYLGALLAGAEMAEALGETTRALDYREVFERGKAWTAQHLFNGRYFIQRVDISDRSLLQDFDLPDGRLGHIGGSIFDLYWSDEHQEIKYQILDGCEIDQVLAQWHANLYGLGEIFEQGQFESAVRAIHEYNFSRRLGDVPNPCRVFGMAEESGTVMCAWPTGAARPAIPVPYSQETMHGFEYAFGSQLMMIGEIDKGVDVYAAVRNRYRGHNRNPWNEIECGSNYARSMASYAALLVLSGFSFDGEAGTMGFHPLVQRRGRFDGFWSNGHAWGVVAIERGCATLSVRHGRLSLTSLTACGVVFDRDRLAGCPGAEEDGDRVAFRPGAVVTLVSPKLSPEGCHTLDDMETNST